jgi:hypothetical protein
MKLRSGSKIGVDYSLSKLQDAKIDLYGTSSLVNTAPSYRGGVTVHAMKVYRGSR